MWTRLRWHNDTIRKNFYANRITIKQMIKQNTQVSQQLRVCRLRFYRKHGIWESGSIQSQWRHIGNTENVLYVKE